jgi:hypothetical protein
LVVVEMVPLLEQIMLALLVLIPFYPQLHQPAEVVAALTMKPLRGLTVVQVVEHQIHPILHTVELELLVKGLTEVLEYLRLVRVAVEEVVALAA